MKIGMRSIDGFLLMVMASALLTAGCGRERAPYIGDWQIDYERYTEELEASGQHRDAGALGQTVAILLKSVTIGLEVEFTRTKVTISSGMMKMNDAVETRSYRVKERDGGKTVLELSDGNTMALWMEGNVLRMEEEKFGVPVPLLPRRPGD